MASRRHAPSPPPPLTARAPTRSHRWLDPSHPDPEAKNLRERWLPALEWYYSERLKQLDGADDAATWKMLSDEALMEAADFGVFIDLASMMQHEKEEWKLGLHWAPVKLKEGESTPAFGTALADAPPALIAALEAGTTSFERAQVDGFGIEGLSWSSTVSVGRGAWFQPSGRDGVETRLFKLALDNLDVLYAHKNMASFLSTRLPEGVSVLRGYGDRGWCARRCSCRLHPVARAPCAERRRRRACVCGCVRLQVQL